MEKSRIDGIIEDYSNGMSLKDIKSKYKTSSDTIYKLIDVSDGRYKNLVDIINYNKENGFSAQVEIETNNNEIIYIIYSQP